MKKIYWVAIIIGFVAIISFLYINQPRNSKPGQEVDFNLTLSELFDEIEAGNQETLSKYQDKLLLLSGMYHSSSDESHSSLIMEDEKGRIANCQLDMNLSTALTKGQEIKIKGIFTGYDINFGEVVMNNCQIE